VRPCFCAVCCAIVIPAAVVNSSSIDNPALNSIQDPEKHDHKKEDERESTGRAQEAEATFSAIAADARSICRVS
jgi:hypothetical protein